MTVNDRLVMRRAERTEVTRGGAVHSLPYLGEWNSETAVVTTGQTVFQPGGELQLHSHNVDESVLVLEGEAQVQIGEEYTDLVAGDATWVKAGTPHRFLNRGTGVMRIYWVYAGRTVTRTLAATGETVSHLDEMVRGGLVPELPADRSGGARDDG